MSGDEKLFVRHGVRVAFAMFAHVEAGVLSSMKRERGGRRIFAEVFHGLERMRAGQDARAVRGPRSGGDSQLLRSGGAFLNHGRLSFISVLRSKRRFDLEAMSPRRAELEPGAQCAVPTATCRRPIKNVKQVRAVVAGGIWRKSLMKTSLRAPADGKISANRITAAEDRRRLRCAMRQSPKQN